MGKLAGLNCNGIPCDNAPKFVTPLVSRRQGKSIAQKEIMKALVDSGDYEYIPDLMNGVTAIRLKNKLYPYGEK